jgi:hypothetical protein
MNYILPEFELKACCGLNNFWVIGAWILFVICYLELGVFSSFEIRYSDLKQLNVDSFAGVQFSAVFGNRD